MERGSCKIKLIIINVSVVLFIIILGVVYMQCTQNNTKNKNIILWSDSRNYKKFVKTLPISAEEALRKLILKVKDRKEKYFDKTPLFIVDDYYFFTTKPMKEAIQLQGYYVNGNTGVIEFRKSDIVTTKKLKELPSDAFSEIEIVE